jgi:hypothetical protein
MAINNVNLGRAACVETVYDSVDVSHEQFLAMSILRRSKKVGTGIRLSRKPFHVMQDKDAQTVVRIGDHVDNAPRFGLRGRLRCTGARRGAEYANDNETASGVHEFLSRDTCGALGRYA